jgi:hypothetical protein
MKQLVALAAAAAVAVGFATAAAAGCGHLQSSAKTASTVDDSATGSQTAQAPRSEE